MLKEKYILCGSFIVTTIIMAYIRFYSGTYEIVSKNYPHYPILVTLFFIILSYIVMFLFSMFLFEFTGKIFGR